MLFCCKVSTYLKLIFRVALFSFFLMKYTLIIFSIVRFSPQHPICSYLKEPNDFHRNRQVFDQRWRRGEYWFYTYNLLQLTKCSIVSPFDCFVKETVSLSRFLVVRHLFYCYHVHDSDSSKPALYPWKSRFISNFLLQPMRLYAQVLELISISH